VGKAHSTRLAFCGRRVVTSSTPSRIQTRSAWLPRHDGNRALLRLPVLPAPTEDKRGWGGPFPATLSPALHPRHLPIPCLDVVFAFFVFPSATERAAACGTFEQNWLVVAHRDEASEWGRWWSGGLLALLTPWVPYMPGSQLQRNFGSGVVQSRWPCSHKGMA